MILPLLDSQGNLSRTIVNLKKLSDFDPKLGILEIRTSDKRICIPATELLLRRFKLEFPNNH